MPIQIVSRWDAAKVLATVKGETLTGADLRGADLRGADLTGADLKGADLTGADLKRADLKRADLKRADLKRADLKRADLTGAIMGACVIVSQAGVCQRMADPYEFRAFTVEGHEALLIRAGCRTMLAWEYREHVAREYPGTRKAEETLACLEYLERMATIRAKEA